MVRQTLLIIIYVKERREREREAKLWANSSLLGGLSGSNGVGGVGGGDDDDVGCGVYVLFTDICRSTIPRRSFLPPSPDSNTFLRQPKQQNWQAKGHTHSLCDRVRKRKRRVEDRQESLLLSGKGGSQENMGKECRR